MKKRCAHGNKEFLAGQESRECCAFISEVGIRGIYLSLTLGTAKFKELDESCFSKPGQAQIYNVVSIKPILPNILFDVQMMHTLYDILHIIQLTLY